MQGGATPARGPDAEQIRAEAALCADLPALEDFRVRWLGKKGEITALLKSLGGAPPDERAARGAAINALKEAVAGAWEARKGQLEAAQQAFRCVAVLHRLRPRGPARALRAASPAREQPSALGG